MFNIGTEEVILILVVVLLLFGAKRIPEVARSLGKGVGDFRDALSGVERELKGEPPPYRPGQPPASPLLPPPQSVAREVTSTPHPARGFEEAKAGASSIEPEVNETAAAGTDAPAGPGALAGETDAAGEPATPVKPDSGSRLAG